MNVTSHRQVSGIHQLRLGDKKIGEAWRCPGKPFFLMRLNGIFWSKGEPNTRGGFTTVKAKRLKDAAALAEKTLTAPPPAWPA